MLVGMGMILFFLLTHYKGLATVIHMVLEVVNLNSNNSLNYCKNMAEWMLHVVIQVLSHMHALSIENCFSAHFFFSSK